MKCSQKTNMSFNLEGSDFCVWTSTWNNTVSISSSDNQISTSGIDVENSVELNLSRSQAEQLHKRLTEILADFVKSDIEKE